VHDLQLIDNGDGTYTLTWSYRNVGDYNQDGIVSISDITPLAVHFNETATPENEWIDGNGDSVINIADITPLAANFFTDCAGYRVQGQTAPGSWTQVAEVPFSLAIGEGECLRFDYDLGALAHDFYRVLPYEASGLGGVRSVIVPESASQPPNILEVSPHGGTSGESVTFNAIVEGPAPLSYAWDFGGGASPNTSSDDAPTVTLGQPGDHAASVTVSNAFGEDIYPFTLTVTEGPPGRGDWWMFGRQPTHNRRSPYLGAQCPSFKWSYETGDLVDSSPAIGANGTIYVGSFDGHLYAIKPDGTLKWRYQTGDGVSSSPAIGADGTIYVGSNDGYLYALNPEGTLKWRYWMDCIVVDSSPAIGRDGTIYVGSHDNYLYAIKPDGTLKWRYHTDGVVSSSPAIGADGTVYVGSEDGYFYAITDSETEGTLKWRYETAWPIRSSPAIADDGTIYVGMDFFYLYALNPDGTLKWRYQPGAGVSVTHSAPAIGADGTIYLASEDFKLDAITDGETAGTLSWQFSEFECWLTSSPAIGADGTVYIISGDPYCSFYTRLYALSSAGEVTWEYVLEAEQLLGEVVSSPAIAADGTIYVGIRNYLYAFGD